ncbi:MAG TPA: hypothetical protein VH741_00485, partial [Candidatus Limnocylindrales bacterium]
FVVDVACGGWALFCDQSLLLVVVVPPSWPDSGELALWNFAEGKLSRGSVAGLPDRIRARLPHDGPWTAAQVGDRLWVHFNGVDPTSAQQVMADHLISEPWTATYIGNRYWVDVGVSDGYPAAAKLDFLRRDRRICAADLITFDPAVLKGGQLAEPLTPPLVVGCAAPP